MNRSYISTWALPEDLKNLRDTATVEDVRVLAEDLLKDYRPLVEIVLVSPQGWVMTKQSVLEDLELPFRQGPEGAHDYFLSLLRSHANGEPEEPEPEFPETK